MLPVHVSSLQMAKVTADLSTVMTKDSPNHSWMQHNLTECQWNSMTATFGLIVKILNAH